MSAGDGQWVLRLSRWNAAAGRPEPKLPEQRLKLGDDGALTVILDAAQFERGAGAEFAEFDLHVAGRQFRRRRRGSRGERDDAGRRGGKERGSPAGAARGRHGFPLVVQTSDDIIAAM